MTTTSWISSLTDAGIKTDMQSLTANGASFSYADALQVLQDVAARGTVTSAEFADLQTIAGNLETQNGITSSSYVTSIFYQLTEGSEANASWTGGQTTTTTLGNLEAGTTSAQLNQLIEKWFLGADSPDPTASSDSSQATLHPTYADFSAYALFGTSGTPQITDVAQGYDGDCELCSGMIEVLENHPSLISSMFVNDGNGVYGVRFYVDGKATWVTVNSELPTYETQLLYNDPLLSGSNDGLWASLIEKAYAELSADGLIGHPATNSYDNISADTAYNVLTNLTNTNSVQYLLSTSANWTSYKNIIIEAVEAGNDVVLETGSATTDYTTNASGQKLLVADHAFAVIGYDSATGDFIVRNPWGVEPYDTSYVTQFEVSMSDVVTVDGDFALDNSASPNVVFNFAEQIAGLASTTNASFSTAQAMLSANAYVRLASMVAPMDTAGLAITDYKIELIGTGGLNLNGATNLATAAQQAAGEVVVSASDFSKLTLSTGSSGGDIDLFISGNDGSGWSTPTEIYWDVDSTELTIIPVVDPIVAPSTAISVSKLFGLSGPLSSESGITYFVSIESGGGTLNLNGGTDLLGGDGRGQIEVSAADLAKLTFTNSGTFGISVLDVTAADSNGHTSDLTQVSVDVGYSVALTLSTFDSSSTLYQVGVADTAANVFANLDQLEQMMPSWALLGITLTDSTIPTETITAAQLTADRGVLSVIDSTMVLDVTASGATQTITGLSNMATVVVLSGTASQYTLTEPGNGVLDVANSSGTTTISNVVALQFSDHEVIVASSTAASGEAVSSAQITNLYAAVFAREPDVAGLNYYEQYAAANPTVGIVTYAQFFLSSPEYTGNTAHNYAQTEAGEASFITDTYQNLLHRAPEAGGVTYYEGVIDPMLANLTPGTTAYAQALLVAHATVLAYFSQSPEFLTDVQVTAANPASATHWLVLV